MISETLCMGCMTTLADSTVCSECGWQEGQPPETPVQLEPRTELAGQYLVGRSLGHGGFGIVYLGWDMNLELRVAIKEYLPGDYATRSPDRTSVAPYSGPSREYFEYGLAKFLEEGRAIARFNDHPGIVPVLNYFKANGTGYLVMSYIPGRTMKEHLIARGGRLPYQETLAIAMPVMDTLRAVHEVGLLHRDISPDNIYISNSRQVKLLDFGAARLALGDKSKSLSVILKAGYAPKEQYQTKGNQGPWTDVYALGATIYRSLTGQIPPEALDRNERDEMVLPRALGVDIPAAAEAVLQRALAVNPDARYATMAAFQEALSAASQRSGITPRPEEVDEPDERNDSNSDNRRNFVPPVSGDAFQKIADLVLPTARRVNAVVANTGLKPADLAQNAAPAGAAAAAGLVGAIGAWSSLSSLAIGMAMPGFLGPLSGVSSIAGLAGNSLLLLSALLTVRNDARGPVVGWAAAWGLGFVSVLSFALYVLNYASVSGLLFAWQIAQPQFTVLFVALMLLAVVIVMFSRRRA